MSIRHERNKWKPQYQCSKPSSVVTVDNQSEDEARILKACSNHHQLKENPPETKEKDINTECFLA